MFNLSQREYSAWGTALALLVFGGLYVHSFWRLWQDDGLGGAGAFGLLLGYTIGLVVVLVIYHVVLALLTGSEPADERDRLIEWRSGYLGGLVLAFGVISIVIQIFLEGLLDIGHLQSPLAIAHALLLVVFLATFLELGLKLFYYRHGIRGS